LLEPAVSSMPVPSVNGCRPERQVVAPFVGRATHAEDRRAEADRTLIAVIERIGAQRLRGADRYGAIGFGLSVQGKAPIQRRLHPEF